MHLGYRVHVRTARAGIALIASLLLALCMAIFVLLAEYSQQTFGIDELWSPLLSVLGQEVQRNCQSCRRHEPRSGRCAMKVHDFAELPLALAALISFLAFAADAQEKNETRYVVGRY